MMIFLLNNSLNQFEVILNMILKPLIDVYKISLIQFL